MNELSKEDFGTFNLNWRIIDSVTITYGDQSDGSEHWLRLVWMFFYILQPSSMSKIKWTISACTIWMLYRMQIYHTQTIATFIRENRPIKMIDTITNDIEQFKTDICHSITDQKRGKGTVSKAYCTIFSVVYLCIFKGNLTKVNVRNNQRHFEYLGQHYQGMCNG